MNLDGSYPERPAGRPKEAVRGQIFQNQPRFSNNRSTAHQKAIVTNANACERNMGSAIHEKPPR